MCVFVRALRPQVIINATDDIVTNANLSYRPRRSRHARVTEILKIKIITNLIINIKIIKCLYDEV